MANTNSNHADKNFMDAERKSYATIASYAAVAAASGLALYGERDVSSVVVGAAVGTAYAYLAGNMADSVGVFMGTGGKVAVGTLAAAGSFLMTAGVVDCVESLKGNSQFDSAINEALNNPMF